MVEGLVSNRLQITNICLHWCLRAWLNRHTASSQGPASALRFNYCKEAIWGYIYQKVLGSDEERASSALFFTLDGPSRERMGHA